MFYTPLQRKGCAVPTVLALCSFSVCPTCAAHKVNIIFKVEGEWWTWIDYERFQELVQAQEESGGQQGFSALDYMAKTPSWALFGATEQGFEPVDTRFHRRNKTKDISGC
ncbi:S-adenosyl-L-methionine-dependent tRNA 4-demethylwyosine synthase [Dissostichus eleginoides]|nr:S-adenosyl-L-methionine-dependent tRNA 4-demethylwyosine synthase [Dissostichus eleginoides]